MIAIDVSGSGEPLVLFHGVGASRIVWRHVTPLLAPRRMVIAPDLPGFGESAPAGPGFDLGRTAVALAEPLAERAGGRSTWSETRSAGRSPSSSRRSGPT